MWQTFQNLRIPGLLNKMLIYFLILYVLIILGRSVWFNWQLNQNIKNTQTQIANLEKQNRDFENLILYYRSESFREVEARQKLGLKKPGEKVVAVPTKNYENYQEETLAEKELVSDLDVSDNSPNWRKWWQLFFS